MATTGEIGSILVTSDCICTVDKDKKVIDVKYAPYRGLYDPSIFVKSPQNYEKSDDQSNLPEGLVRVKASAKHEPSEAQKTRDGYKTDQAIDDIMGVTKGMLR